MPPNATDLWEGQKLIEKLKAEKNAGVELQKRKHQDWNDNYELYRGRVKTNRLTQRQAVHIPLMKETVKTLLSEIDETPNIEWNELGGEEDKEILYQEIWDTQFTDNKLELVDILDKKNVLLYGIGTTIFNIAPTGIPMDAMDPYDVLFDPMMKVGDIESARFLVRQNIFKSVREILADEKYDESAKEQLKGWIDTPAGVTQGNKNREQYEKKMERMKAMGVSHADFALFAGGDRVIALTEHFTTTWSVEKKDWERRLVTYADDQIVLRDKTLQEVMGVDFWPMTTWGEDPEVVDQYPDSVADLVRVPNKVIDVFVSQMIENRTLKNFQMHWFSPVQGYKPQTYTPGPGVMLPAPPGDDIRKVIMPVEVSGLDDTANIIDWLTQIVERGSGATAIKKGESEKGEQTLGEVKALLTKATERTIGMSKFYRMAWFERAWKWDALMHANAPKIINLYKKSRSGKMYTKRVYGSDWKSEVGYKPVVSSSSEREAETLGDVNKFRFLLAQFPNNMALRKIAQKRMLESVDLSPDELKAVEEAEDTAQERMIEQGNQAGKQDIMDIESGIKDLTTLATQ